LDRAFELRTLSEVCPLQYKEYSIFCISGKRCLIVEMQWGGLVWHLKEALENHGDIRVRHGPI
jgi:hypothetical protein